MPTALFKTARNERRAAIAAAAIILLAPTAVTGSGRVATARPKFSDVATRWSADSGATARGSPLATGAVPAQETDLERLRREGAVAFERAIARLASRRDDLQRLRARYARDCTGRVDQPRSGKRSRTRSLGADPVWKADLPECRSLSKAADELAATIRQRVGDAEERARRHGVYPGTLRETRRAHGLESAEFGR